jgi:peptidoglycan/xylan/chitin deacetylase (PgdA/CDA1 family)
VYKFNGEKKIDVRKIILILILILFIICAFFTSKNIIIIINEHKAYKQYEAQLNALKHQDEEKQRKIAEEQERIKKERNPVLTDEGRKNIENIYKSDKKVAYLTFDDGPSPVTESILNILKQEKVKATFFVLGSNIDDRKEMVKRMYDEGHYVANHGYSHVYSKIYSSAEAVLEEYNQTNEIIRNAIGNPEYNSHLFRFPGGLPGGKYAALKLEAKELLNQNDILNIDWNALNGDAETNDLSPEFELQRLSETVGDKNSIVILMHDAALKSVTAETLPQIISALREKGYEFENFYSIIK